MSGQSRDRRKRALKNNTRHRLERLEGRALLASIAEFGLTSNSNPAYITSGPNGNLWFTEPGTDKIGEITTSGTVTEFALTSGSYPQGITTGPDGNLWFTESHTDKIGEITTGGTITEFALTSGSYPQEITTGSNGNLWFTENDTDKIGEIVPSGGSVGTITEFALASGSHPYGITSGPNGNLWFTENGANKVGQIVPSGTFAGTINTYSLSSGAGPEGITTGSDGNLWFAENGGSNIGQVTLGGSVTEYSIPGGDGGPREITSGPLGDLYFTELTGNNIVQMTTQGAFTDFAVPASTSYPIGITQGPDNHIWFAEYNANKIGRLNLNPTAVNDTYNTVSGIAFNVNAPGLMGNDSDPEGDSLFVSSYNQPSHGSLNVNLDGSFGYTATAGYSGSDSFTYQISDGTDTSTSATVNLTVRAENAPVAVPDSYTALENTPLAVTAVNGVLANDSDADGDTIHAVLVNNPSHFNSFTFNGTTGAFNYTPTAGFYGTDSFTYKDNDGYENGNTVTVTITVDAPPVAVNDSFSALENTPLTVNAAGVLANDAQAQGNPLTASVVANPTYGTLTLNANGSFTYTPNANFFGIDSFTYLDNDGNQNGNTATVSIRVDAPPSAVNDTYRYLLNTTLSPNAAAGVLVNDTQAQGDTLTAVIIANPTHGTVTLNADGSFSYIPNNGYTGADSFTYQDNDGYQNGNTATVNLTLDHLPVAVADTYSTYENNSLLFENQVNGVLANDTDADGDTLTAIDVTNPTHGSLTLNGLGSFNYVPNANFYGTDTFTYKDNDGYYNGNTTTVTINVYTPPVVINKSFNDVKNTSLNLLASQGLLIGATNTDGNPITAVDLTQPTHGTVTVNADGSFQYIPTTGYYGNDSFTYTASNNGINGNTGTVSIYVDQPPVGVADNYAVVENTGLNKNASTGVLANDSDTNGATLTAGLVATTTHGTLNFFADGSFTYAPTVGYYGLDSFTYQANDGITDSPITTVTITVDAPPVGVPDSYTAVENTTLTKTALTGVLANDTDPDTAHATLTATLVSNSTHGTVTLFNDGSFSYIPNANYFGSDSFTYKPYDQITNGAITTVSITVDAPPVAVNDSYTAIENTTLNVTLASNGVLANDTDPDTAHASLTAVVATLPTHGTLTLNADGTLTYIPIANYYGTDTFTYNVNDGTTNGLTPATVTITVDAPPVAVNDTYTTVENTTLNVPLASNGVLANDTDPDTAHASLTAVVATLPTHGTLTLNANGSFTYIPTAGYYGTDTFTYNAYDGTTNGLTPATVTITIDAPPVAVNDAYNAVENTTLNVPLASNGVLANDTDPDTAQASLTAVVATLPTHGTLTLNADGSFTYIPNANFYGTDSFTYNAYDGTTNGLTPATVTITVDHPPVAINDSFSVVENNTLTENSVQGVLTNDTDYSSNPLSAVVATLPSHGTLTLNADGSFTYIPTTGYYGTDSFTYNAYDGISNSLTPATVGILVDAPPVAVNDSYYTEENTTLTLIAVQGVLINDTQAQGHTLTAIDVTQPSHGTLTLNADGSFTYIPTTGYYGADSFTYQDTDGIATSTTATVSLAVHAPPVAVPDSYTAIENTTLTVNAANGVLANDTSTEPIQSYVNTNPTHGTLSLNIDGSFTYIPTAGFYGTDSFTYTANDTADSAAYTGTTVTITVDAPPVANNISYNAREGHTLTENAVQGVLASATDPDTALASLTAVVVSQPTHGTLTLNANGSFTYTPTGLYFGPDSFTFNAYDGTTNSVTPATVTLNVIQDNVPVAVNDSQTVGEGGFTATAPGILANDTDADSDPLTALLVTGPAHGTLTFHGDGSYTYIPNSSFGTAGSDTFTYRAFDGVLAGNVATVTLTFDGTYYAPTALPQTYSGAEGATLSTSAPSLLTGASDYWGLGLTAVDVTQPSHGTVTVNTDGSFTYMPTAGFFGTDSFTYEANNGHVNSTAQTVTLNVSQTFGAPVAGNDSYTAIEATPLAKTALTGVLSNDSDPNSLPLTAILVTNPAHGSVAFNADGSFTYIPAAGFYGTDSFTYTDNDGHNNSNTATVTLTVSQVFYAPIAVNDTYTTSEATSLTKTALTGVLANDTDPQALPLTASLVSGPAHSGSFNLNADGSFTYTPAVGFYGTDSFTYTDNDGHNTSTTATVTLTVNQVFYTPVAVNDSYSATEATPLTVNAAGGVLANDTDLNSLPLTAILVTNPSHGSVALNADGSFTYTPAVGFFGNDSFTYKDNDGSLNSNTATVNLAVSQVFYAPIAVNDSYTTSEATVLTKTALTGVLANDTDPQALPLTASVVAAPVHGLLNLSADGSFTYTPAVGFYGTDSFTYTDNDGHNTSTTATVTLTVNQVFYTPVAVNDSYSATEATPLTVNAAGGVLANDTDLNSLPLTAILVTNPSHGSVALNADGSFTYTPAVGFFGNDSFTYKDNDGSLNSNTATVNLAVSQVFYAPIAVNDSYTTSEATVLTKTALTGVLANDTDPQALPLTASVVAAPVHGLLNLSADGSFTYTPAVGFYGTDSFTYTDNDGHNTSTTATVTLTVNQVFYTPVAVNDSYSATEATPLTVNAAGGVLANDTDLNSLPLTAILVTNPSHGSVALNADGSFTYTPAVGFFGNDSFTYKDNDGSLNSNTATVNLAVTQVFYTPVVVNDAYSVTENTVLTKTALTGVLANDTDPQALPLTASLVSGPAHSGSFNLNADGSFTYTPTAGFFGTDSFTYNANDGHNTSTTATVTLTVGQVLSSPIAVNDTYTVAEGATLTKTALTGVLANDTDPNSLPLSAILVTNPSHGSVALNADGSFTYIPAAGFFGNDSFTYKDNDGSLNGNTATVNLAVSQVFYAPVVANDAYSVTENTVLTKTALTGVLANDTDPQALPLTASVVVTPVHGLLSLSADGSFTYTPAPNFYGTDSFTYTANDGHNTSTTATVTLTISQVLSAPIAVNDTYTVAEGATLTKTALTGLLANDTDPQALPLTAILVTNPSHGSVALNADGSFTYTPAVGYYGADSFTYKDNDGSLNGNTATVTLAVSQVFYAPVVANDTYSATENIVLTKTALTGVLANDTDPQVLPLTAILVTNPAHGSVSLSADGSFTYTPTAGFFGTDSFTYNANDGHNNSNTATVTLTVSQVFYAPVAVNDSYTTSEATPLTKTALTGVLANDTDPQALPLTAILVTNPAHGSVALNADGSFTYIPAAGFFGNDSFTYKDNDGSLNGNTATVTLAVSQVFYAPVVVNDTYTATEATPLIVNAAGGVLANDTDPQALPLTASVVAAPVHGLLTLGVDGSFTYTPTAGFLGTDSFTYTANDGHNNSTAATVTLTVTNPTNHAPVAVNDTGTATQGTSLVVSAPGLLANDTDADNDTLTALLVTGPAHGQLTFGGDGSYTYLPNPGYTGLDSFSYRAFDGLLTSNLATVSLTVNPAPTPAPATPGDYDGDHKADVAVYISTLGAYDIHYSSGTPDQLFLFGTAGVGQSLPAPGDYDHSGKTEMAVYLPASGMLAIKDKANGGVGEMIPFGTPGAGKSIPAPGDYFGTGQTDVAVYLTSTGTFALRNPMGGPDTFIQFGTPGLGNSIPVPGDYDGSGKTEFAVYMPSTGTFAYRPANGGPDVIKQFGTPGAGKSIPVPGDYDGSGKTEFAVYMPSTGTFAYRPASGGADVMVPFGVAGAGQTLVAPGDYTGVGHDQMAAYMPAYATFAVRVGAGLPDVQVPIGIPGLGVSFPVTVVDEALAQMGPTVSTMSIEIPDPSDLIDPANKKRK